MTFDDKTAREIATDLLKIKAIQLSPEKSFKWASGWNSPIYCDNRLSLSFPELRLKIKHKLVSLIREKFSQVDIIAGVATAGIPQGALVADELNKPFIYVRSQPKGHGLTNQIEGKIDPGAQVVVVEDLVSTGGSSLKAVKALREVEFNVLGMVAIFSYGFNVATDNFEKESVQFYCLSDYLTMLEVALQENYIESSKLEVLKEWRADPENWKA